MVKIENRPTSVAVGNVIGWSVMLIADMNKLLLVPTVLREEVNATSVSLSSVSFGIIIPLRWCNGSTVVCSLHSRIVC